jgi:hypothetical protein
MGGLKVVKSEKLKVEVGEWRIEVGKITNYQLRITNFVCFFVGADILHFISSVGAYLW